MDFFLDAEEKFWFNEINPMPGFTPISLYPKIWQEEAPVNELIDQLIILAFERFRLQEKIFAFSSKMLSRS